MLFRYCMPFQCVLFPTKRPPFPNISIGNFSGIFEIEQDHLKMTVCPRHRDLFGTRWRCNKSRCTIPMEIAAHKASAPKAQCGLKTAQSAHVLKTTKMLLPVGSRTYFTLFKNQKCTSFNCLPVREEPGVFWIFWGSGVPLGL